MTVLSKTILLAGMCLFSVSNIVQETDARVVEVQPGRGLAQLEFHSEVSAAQTNDDNEGNEGDEGNEGSLEGREGTSPEDDGANGGVPEGPFPPGEEPQEEMPPAEEMPPPEEMPAEEMPPPEEMPAEEMPPPEEMPAEEMPPPEEMPAEEMPPPEDMPAEEMPAEEMPPPEEMPAEEMPPPEEMPAEEMDPAEEEMPAEEPPAEETPVEEAPDVAPVVIGGAAAAGAGAAAVAVGTPAEEPVVPEEAPEAPEAIAPGPASIAEVPISAPGPVAQCETLRDGITNASPVLASALPLISPEGGSDALSMALDDETNSVTVLLPNEEILQSLGALLQNSDTTGVTPEQVQVILLDHVLVDPLEASELIALGSGTVLNANNEEVELIVDGTDVMFMLNNITASVVEADIDGCSTDSVIHRIDNIFAELPTADVQTDRGIELPGEEDAAPTAMLSVAAPVIATATAVAAAMMLL